MHVTLIYPSVGRKENRPYVRAWQMQPLSMAVLAGATPNNIELAFFDDRLESIDYEIRTDLVCISVETFTALRAYQIARRFRRRGIPVVMGGYHVTLCPEEAKQECDAIVVGDAEVVWNKVLSDVEAGNLQCNYDGRGERVLSGIQSRRSIFADRKYQRITLVEFARGCNFRCDFCSITAYHRARQNHRPAVEVAEEMRRTGSKRFFIVDDNIASQPEQTRRLCDAIAPLNVSWVGQTSIHIAQDDDLLEQMANSGCLGVLIGMESINPANLKAMGKSWNTAQASYEQSLRQFRKHGLAVYGTFVFGYDEDDAKVIEESVAFAKEQKLFLAAFNHLVPFPGTPLYKRLAEEGRLLTEKWWLDNNGRVGDVTFRPRRMAPDELQEACLEARRQFYSFSSISSRMLDRKANAASVMMAGIYLGLNLGAHYDVDLRQGLQLGASYDTHDSKTKEPIHLPISHAG